MQRRTPLKSVAYAWNRSYDARIYIKIIKHLKICSYIFLIVFLFLMYLPPAKFCNVMTSFFSFDSTWFIECVLFAATMKKHKQMIKTKTLNLKLKKGSCEKSKQKNVLWYGGHLSLVSRFGARLQGFEQSGWREQSKEHDEIHNTF